MVHLKQTLTLTFCVSCGVVLYFWIAICRSVGWRRLCKLQSQQIVITVNKKERFTVMPNRVWRELIIDVLQRINGFLTGLHTRHTALRTYQIRLLVILAAELGQLKISLFQIRFNSWTNEKLFLIYEMIFFINNCIAFSLWNNLGILMNDRYYGRNI